MDYVYVYCGGKCGSSTLHTTFVNNNYDSMHVHGNSHYQSFCKDPSTIFEHLDITCKKHERVYVIDSYRTPIERKISSFFQNITHHLPNYRTLSIQDMIAWFNDNFIFHHEEYHSINEALTYYNLPLFTKFDFTKRYNIMQYKNITFIKILFNHIQNWENILSQIFQKKIIMHNDNLTKNKETYGLYKKFKQLYKVPQTYLYNALLQDAEFKIYNSQTEQTKYIRMWSQKSICLPIREKYANATQFTTTTTNTTSTIKTKNQITEVKITKSNVVVICDDKEICEEEETIVSVTNTVTEDSSTISELKSEPEVVPPPAATTEPALAPANTEPIVAPPVNTEPDLALPVNTEPIVAPPANTEPDLAPVNSEPDVAPTPTEC